MLKHPRIAITASSRAEDGTTRLRLNTSYVRAVEQADAIPVVVPPLADPEHAGDLLEGVDALLLTGGEDVDPVRFGAAPHPRLGTVHAERDATELALVAAARERALPTLAICRGIQLLNVAFGGTLVQDIPSERPGALDHDPAGARDARTHPVEIAPDSRLATLVGPGPLTVNSFHHQSADRLGAGFRLSAWAPDGVVEGIEWTDDDWWAVAIQWHAEELIGPPASPDRGLFAGLVRAARERRALATR